MLFCYKLSLGQTKTFLASSFLFVFHILVLQLQDLSSLFDKWYLFSLLVASGSMLFQYSLAEIWHFQAFWCLQRFIAPLLYKAAFAAAATSGSGGQCAEPRHFSSPPTSTEILALCGI